MQSSWPSLKAFKTWHHYLEGCKHKFLVLTNHNNLRRFMHTKSLSSCQVRWAQKLSRYHFQIDYQHGKANGAIDALSRFSQRSSNEEEKLQAENTQILHRLQTSLTSASLSGLSLIPDLSSLHQVLICGTYVQPQFCEFWTNLQAKLANKHLYWASIGEMRLRLPELQKLVKEVWSIRAKGELQDGYQEIDRVVRYQRLLFVPKVVQTKIISQYHDNPLAGYFDVDKTKKLIEQKYHWPSLRKDVESYIKNCNVCLGSKAARHKPYDNL